ncbi:pyruvate kinase [Candidatus Xianfuyuplasma coldseepsis]|uniref:Pyruvate kinase n=1 Tax=Candidatus Xianfuyuplasma coldseepsis TaxID=2782163 RepID=A0A7L7KPP5_9MOLU|nr:pyruvate kinase [Xianfuyuplasma coldseepsis]QMS84760.1 pyruvate kinase [Xianfuyuplasma coldseepsis]
MKPFNQTKIICTIGPASESYDVMKELALAGMDVMRMNFSHGVHDDHLQRMKTLERVNKDTGLHIATLLDTKGPEIRTHLFKDGKATIFEGADVLIHMDEIEGTSEAFSVNYPNLYNDIKVGECILVDDGYLELEVTHINKKAKTITAVAKNTHTLKNRKGINVPGVKLNLDFISSKDYDDIKWGCEHNVDFIAASFVRRASDIQEIRNIMKYNGNSNIQIIAKIENKEGVDNIEEIIDIADGIMVARGDLGVEVPAEEVPIIQKDIINKCLAAGKVSVTATQMLESMIEHPRPTRAEVSDVANAIYDGTDAIMLSGESAIGEYPIESVETMARIAHRIEEKLDRRDIVKRANKESISSRTIATSIAISVAYTVIQSKVDLIIVPTMTGRTAKYLSKFRPNARILALTTTEAYAKGLQLHSGVEPVEFELVPDTETVVKKAIALAKKDYGIKKGDRVIITGGFPIGAPTNGMRIIDIE